MAIDYKSPGVSVKEYTEATIAPLLAAPDSICLVGPVSGVVTATKDVTLTGTTAVSLVNSADGTLSSITSVYDLDPSNASALYNTSSGYQAASYTVSTDNGTIARKSPTTNGVSVTGLKVTTTSSSTTATLSGSGTLAANSTYSISASTYIPSANNITFKTPSSITQTVYSAGTVSTSGSSTTVTGTTTAFTSSMVGATLTVGTTTKTITAVDTNAQTLTVDSNINISTGSTYTISYYVITLSSSTGVTSGVAQVATITSSEPTIPDNARVRVTYKYTPLDYWDAKIWYDVASIQDRFGPKYNDAQTIVNSPITLAAEIAFANGANSVIIQPVFYQNTSTAQKTAPTNDQIANDGDGSGTTWTATLNALRTVDNVGILVPVIGQDDTYTVSTKDNSIANIGNSVITSIFQKIAGHVVYQQQNNDQYIIAVFGEDGTNNTSHATQAILQADAVTLQSINGGDYNQNFVLISRSKFTRATPNGSSLALGGQYAAAAIAGMLISRPVQQTLTRKNIIGFSAVTDVRSKAQMIDDSKKGLFVIQQNGSAVQVRHAITTDISTVAKSELSVVRTKAYMINSLRKTIDEQIIGKVVSDNNAPLVVASAISGVLTTMVSDGEIVNFSNLQAKFLTGNPTAIDVRFSYLPAFPINYVQIGFSVDLTTGTLTLNSSQQTGAV